MGRYVLSLESSEMPLAGMDYLQRPKAAQDVMLRNKKF